jgi:uncharacterized protein (DUF1330 family)
MKGYFVVNARVVDQQILDSYLTSIGTSIEDHGGKIIVATNDAVTVEGEPEGQRLVVLEFPSVEAVQAWYNSPEYTGPKALRLQATAGIALLAEGRS